MGGGGGPARGRPLLPAAGWWGGFFLGQVGRPLAEADGARPPGPAALYNRHHAPGEPSGYFLTCRLASTTRSQVPFGT